MKHIICNLIAQIFFLVCFSQIEYEKLGNIPPKNNLSKEDIAMEKAAVNLYLNYRSFLIGIPSDNYSKKDLRTFIREKFMKGAYIEEKVETGLRRLDPQTYFDILAAKYAGANAKFDESSEIQAPIQVDAVTKSDENYGTFIEVKFEQLFLNKLKGISTETIQESRSVIIYFESSGKFKIPLIKYILIK